MENFMYYAPTKVVFGKGTENKVGSLVKEYGGTRVIVVYGGGSAVRSGLIDRVGEALDAAELPYITFGGAKPNPTLAHAEEGVRRAVEFGADFVVAVGGGSAIDTGKGIAVGTANAGTDLWSLWTKQIPLTKDLPIGAVLTIPAAGSEMSDSAVLTNEELGIKKGLGTDFNRCKFAVMNPELAMTLPAYQIAAGVTDIMMHTMERYFIPDSDCDMTDEIAEGLLRTVIKNGRSILRDPRDYHAMAEVMWCSSVSHNNITGLGRPKDFSVHKFGHALSAMYDYTHGATLAAVWKSWAQYVYLGALPRFAKYARNVWGVTEEDDLKAASEGIARTVAYFKEIGMPVSIADLGAHPSDEDIVRLAMNATQQGTVTLTQIMPVGEPEAEEIFRGALN